MGVIGEGPGASELPQSDHLISGSTWSATSDNKSRIQFVSGQEFYQKVCEVCGKVYLAKTLFISSGTRLTSADQEYQWKIFGKYFIVYATEKVVRGEAGVSVPICKAGDSPVLRMIYEAH